MGFRDMSRDQDSPVDLVRVRACVACVLGRIEVRIGWIEVAQ
jgi:hypothetical protein